jgi:hypothetical protein
MKLAPKRLYLLIGSLVVLGVVPAAALAQRSSSRATSSTTFQVSPLQAPVTYESGAIRFDVPDPTAAPTITPEQAMKTYQLEGAPTGLDQLGGVADMHLAVFSDANYGPYDANGNVKPNFQNVLSWMIVFHNVDMVPTGPARPADVTAAPSTTYPKCDAIQVINASTGDFMLAIQTCEHVTE